jgi:hypothetical protein
VGDHPAQVCEVGLSSPEVTGVTVPAATHVPNPRVKRIIETLGSRVPARPIGRAGRGIDDRGREHETDLPTESD